MQNIRLLVLSCAAIGVALTALGACQNTDTSSDTGGAGGTSSSAGGTSSNAQGGSGGMVSPAACAMPSGNACMNSVTPNVAYQMFQGPSSMSTQVSSAPNIRRVRMGIGGNVAVGAQNRADPSTSFAVGWQTDDLTMMTDPLQQTLATTLQWGTCPDPTMWPAANSVQGYTWITPMGSLNGSLPTTGPARMHEAYVCGLSPNTTYYYRVGGGPAGSEQWSPVYSHATTPAPGQGSITIALTGDSRGEQMNAWQLLQAKVTSLAPTLQLFSGDMTNLAPDEQEWNQWLDNAETDPSGNPSALSSILTLAAHGNHDNHGVLFFSNVVLPQDTTYAQTYGELFYSFDVGPAHIVVLDDQYIADMSNPDYNTTLGTWLDQDLGAANANRANVPWVITAHHHPVFSSSLHGMDVDVATIGNFLSTYFDKYHVDLDIAGHDHDYERSKSLNGNRANPTVDASPGTVYLVCAGSGADPYASATSTFTAASADYQAGGAIGLYGLLTIDAHNLKLEAHDLTADGSNPMIDSMTLTK